jgi:hypothetical protein
VWRFLPPLHFLNFFNEWWGCCLPPPSRGFLSCSEQFSCWVKMAFLGLYKGLLANRGGGEIAATSMYPTSLSWWTTFYACWAKFWHTKICNKKFYTNLNRRQKLKYLVIILHQHCNLHQCWLVVNNLPVN